MFKLKWLIIIIPLFFHNCAPRAVYNYKTNTMEYGALASVTTGSPIATWEEGLCKQPCAYFKQGVESQLIYAGLSGHTITVYYVEFSTRGFDPLKYARAAFTMSFKYDLSQSKIIAYRDVKVKIIEATNQRLDFIVLSGPEKVWPKETEESSYDKPYRSGDWD